MAVALLIALLVAGIISSYPLSPIARRYTMLFIVAGAAQSFEIRVTLVAEPLVSFVMNILRFCAASFASVFSRGHQQSLFAAPVAGAHIGLVALPQLLTQEPTAPVHGERLRAVSVEGMHDAAMLASLHRLDSTSESLPLATLSLNKEEEHFFNTVATRPRTPRAFILKYGKKR